MNMTFEKFLKTKNISINTIQINADKENITGVVDLKEFKDLKYIILSENKITAILNIPEGLITLDVDYTDLKELKNIPNSLINLDISDTSIVLDKLPPNLKTLSICHNKAFKKMPKLPHSINFINAVGSGLEEFTDFPENIILTRAYEASVGYFRNTPIQKRLGLNNDFDSWEKIKLSFRLKPGDELRGVASISDTGLFDFKN